MLSVVPFLIDTTSAKIGSEVVVANEDETSAVVVMGAGLGTVAPAQGLGLTSISILSADTE